MRKSFLAWLLALIMYAVGSPAYAVSVDCGENQSFTAGLGGWGAWWSGSTPVVDTAVGRTDSRSLRLQGSPGTAARDILPTECPLGIAYVNYWARTQAGSARIYTKLVDQVTGATLYDSINTAPTVVGTTWTRISIPVTITNKTLIGIAADPVSPATSTTVYIDDVVVANDACANQTFATDTGGFSVWWSGNAVARTSPGRTDSWSLKLSGSSYGTAERDISPSECAQPLTRVAYYVRAETGTALVHTKLVDQVTGATLYDSVNSGPVTVPSTTWTRIVINVSMPNTTMIGIAAEKQGGGAVSVLVDDVMLNPGVVPTPPTQPDNVPIPVRNGWTLTFSDDFSNSTLNPTKWAAITTGPTYGSSTEGFGETWGIECYNASQVAIQNGSLQLTAKQQSVSCLGENHSWLSGLVISRDRFSQAYGRFEARIRMPVARGSWPAFWMMPQVQQQWGTCGMYWPCGGEIDILEYVGQLNSSNATESKAVYSTLHWGTSTGGHVQDSGSANVLPSVDRWTVYAAEWDTTGISFYVDDVFVKKVSFPLPNSAGLYTGSQPFSVPFYFILNQSVGGVWPGAPNPADYPSTVKVDYVAAYKRP